MTITTEQHREIEARLERNRTHRHLKCDWPPAVEKSTVGVEDEIRDLHKPIIKFCRSKGWIYLYSNPSRKTGRVLGEPDFCIMLPAGKVLFVECKKRGAVLSPEQTAMNYFADRLGHVIHIVRTMDQFYELVKL